jgi:hypothetical protein
MSEKREKMMELNKDVFVKRLKQNLISECSEEFAEIKCGMQYAHISASAGYTCPICCGSTMNTMIYSACIECEWECGTGDE